MTHLPALAHTNALVVRQQKEMVEIFTDIETSNKYAVSSPDGQISMFAAETEGGAMDFLMRSFLKNKRPFDMVLRDGAGGSTINLHRPWTWFFSRLEVKDAAHQIIGTIQQEFAFFERVFVVTAANGQELGRISGPFFKPWTFNITKGGQPVGKITKQWSGLLKETFSDADTFGVQFEANMEATLRTMALAATFLIDFLYFEDRD